MAKFNQGNILFVDDDGTADYTSIQDAVDAAMDGDKIFVFSGLYTEQLLIDKSLSILGENKNSTIIDGEKNGDVVKITAEYVSLTNLTIKHSGIYEYDFGIEILSNNNTISNNIITKNGGLHNDGWTRGGIYLVNASYNKIENNTICSNDREGIHLSGSNYNTICNNQIYENDYFGMILDTSTNNIIQNNEMYENYVCMSFWPFSTDNKLIGNTIYNHDYYSLSFYSLSDNNIVRYNNFSNNLEWSIKIAGANNNLIENNYIFGSTGGSWEFGYGIFLEYAFNNTIQNNNIINNKENALVRNFYFNNQWKNNYWDDYIGFGPKIIPAEISFPQSSFSIPWFIFDWHPAEQPFETNPIITVGPYTQNCSDNAVTIVWETNIPTENNYVQFGKTTDFDEIKYAKTVGFHHEIIINPDFSSGYYKVVSENVESKDFNFELTSHCYSTNEFKCIFIGDSRGMWDNWKHAEIVADSVNQEQPNVVIHGGDMVDDGTKNSQWESWLTIMKPLMQNSTVFGVMGNHDRKADRYYELFALPHNEKWYSFDSGPCHFIILDNYEPWNIDSLQYAWLKNDLEKTDKEFKIVCFHEPIYCSGGHNPRKDIRLAWEPLFNQYHVNVIFQSHCHYYQRSNPINGTIYVVSGGAGAPLYSPKDAWFVNTSEKTYHYCMLDVSIKKMEMTCVVKDIQGSVIDKFSFDSEGV